LDTLDVLLKSRTEGDREDSEFVDDQSGEEGNRGTARKKAIEHVIVRSRQLGCSSLISDSKEGGFKIRYGSIRYAVLDVNTKGRVYFHVKAHPNKELPSELSEQANEFIMKLNGVSIKNGPINCYGQADQKIEEIPRASIDQFLEYAVGVIQEHYYGRN
jgi:hypothetical protein